MTGSSVPMGEWVPRERTFAALLPLELTGRLNRRVELYNEGMVFQFPQLVVLRFNEVLDAKPDLILWIITPYDIGVVLADPAAIATPPQPAKKVDILRYAMLQAKLAVSHKSLSYVIGPIWQQQVDRFLYSSAGVMLQDFVYRSGRQYVDAYLGQPDSISGFLKVKASAEWLNYIRHFETDAAQIELRAKAAGVPLVAVFIPNRAQVAMVSRDGWRNDISPYQLGNELRRIVEGHGAKYFDLTSYFRDFPGSERYFFPVDGHPTPEGHKLLSHLIANEIVHRSLVSMLSR